MRCEKLWLRILHYQMGAEAILAYQTLKMVWVAEDGVRGRAGHSTWYVMMIIPDVTLPVVACFDTFRSAAATPHGEDLATVTGVATFLVRKDVDFSVARVLGVTDFRIDALVATRARSLLDPARLPSGSFVARVVDVEIVALTATPVAIDAVIGELDDPSRINVGSHHETARRTKCCPKIPAIAVRHTGDGDDTGDDSIVDR